MVEFCSIYRFDPCKVKLKMNQVSEFILLTNIKSLLVGILLVFI